MSDFFNIAPFSLHKEEKQVFFNKKITDLTLEHLALCPEYTNIVNILHGSFIAHIASTNNSLQDLTLLPYMPVNLFKLLDIKSIPNEAIFRTLQSSGTTGSTLSKIYLDRTTALAQTKALNYIVSEFIGKQRLAMLIIDNNLFENKSDTFNARKAAIIGFSQFGSNHFFLLDENMNVKIDGLINFIKKNKDKKILIFGFTFLVWQYFYKYLIDSNIDIDLTGSIMIHGGGWKKMTDQQVNEHTFNKSILETFNIKNIHNYYGIVEQVGSILMSCEFNHLHLPIYADVIIRDPQTFSALPKKHTGFIQILSLLPKSYPGHSLLTEDLGQWLGEDDCGCKRLGKYIKVMGRAEESELRGCSDTIIIG